MSWPILKKCEFLGPRATPESDTAFELPEDYATNPLKYLPPRIDLSPEELQLATQYERGNFTGGYVRSQIARFRRGPTAEQHRVRREKFRRLKEEIDEQRFVLPSAFIELVETDDFVARFRHNTIWLELPDELEPFPHHPELRLFLIFREGQGLGYWHLLLLPEGGHVVTFSEHHFGLRGTFETDPDSFEVYQCAESFAEWIVRFSAESMAHDRNYERLWDDYAAM